eukprot:scaffold7052_cov254-Pinguiococcus_pyrenoidosus.AAC.96
MEDAIDYLGEYPLCLSFDIDAVDPSIVAATGTKVRGGLTYRESHYVCEAIAETGRLVHMDMVESTPRWQRRRSLESRLAAVLSVPEFRRSPPLCQKPPVDRSPEPTGVTCRVTSPSSFMRSVVPVTFLAFTVARRECLRVSAFGRRSLLPLLASASTSHLSTMALPNVKYVPNERLYVSEPDPTWYVPRGPRRRGGKDADDSKDPLRAGSEMGGIRRRKRAGPTRTGSRAASTSTSPST